MSGFLVEVRPGREVLYKTAWALRDAMRAGVISGDSRIFHRATSTWISITQHPEYRRFLLNHEPPAWMDVPEEPSEEVPETAEEPRGLARVSYKFSVGFAALKRALEAARAKREARAAASPPTKTPTPAPRGRGEPEPRQEPPPASPAPPPPSSRRDRWTYFP